jgi:hypothetical protein
MFRELKQAHHVFGFICGRKKSRLVHWDKRVMGNMT